MKPDAPEDVGLAELGCEKIPVLEEVDGSVHCSEEMDHELEGVLSLSAWFSGFGRLQRNQGLLHCHRFHLYSSDFPQLKVTPLKKLTKMRTHLLM